MRICLLLSALIYAGSAVAFPDCGEIQPLERVGSKLTGVMHPPHKGHLKVRFTVGENGQVTDLQTIEEHWEPPRRQREAKRVAKNLLNNVKQWRYAPRSSACTVTTTIRFTIVD